MIRSIIKSIFTFIKNWLIIRETKKKYPELTKGLWVAHGHLLAVMYYLDLLIEERFIVAQRQNTKIGREMCEFMIDRGWHVRFDILKDIVLQLSNNDAIIVLMVYRLQKLGMEGFKKEMSQAIE